MGIDNAKKSGAAIVDQMKKMPTDDDCYGAASVRADGRFLCPAYLFQVKMPSESKYPWDYYKVVKVTSAQDAAAPLATDGCVLPKA
jgi:branched-chain amino acid transport system substrate-binding protein